MSLHDYITAFAAATPSSILTYPIHGILTLAWKQAAKSWPLL